MGIDSVVLGKVLPTCLNRLCYDTLFPRNFPFCTISISCVIRNWEALKEALETKSEENVTKGKVLLTDAVDNLVFNYTDQLVVVIDLGKIIVINTDDVLLICQKSSVPKIKKLVEKLENTPHEHLT